MRKADNLPPSCAVVTKSGNINFLEPSGPVQACNGTALPFFTSVVCHVMNSEIHVSTVIDSETSNISAVSCCHRSSLGEAIKFMSFDSALKHINSCRAGKASAMERTCIKCL